MFPIRLFLVVGFTACLASCGTGSRDASTVGPDFLRNIKVTGEIRSSNSVYVNPPPIPRIYQFTIVYMEAEGARVKKGQPVLRFDAQDINRKILTKRNSLNEKEKELQKRNIMMREQLAEGRLLVEEARADATKAALKADIPDTLLANREYRENQLLLKQARLSLALREAELREEELVQATEARILERQIIILKAEIEEMQKGVDAMTFRTPMDGVLIHSLGFNGNKMVAGDNVFGGQRVMEIADLGQLELHIEVPERDSARVAIGQPVSFALDAAPNKTFHGKITEVASVVHANAMNQPLILDATVALIDADTQLMRPGMSVNAEIRVAPETEPVG
jgi:multidrug efflux pump subunit AcrA (membrane-fusion protein)